MFSKYQYTNTKKIVFVNFWGLLTWNLSTSWNKKKTPLQHPWKTTETFLKHHRNCLFMKLAWNIHDTSLAEVENNLHPGTKSSPDMEKVASMQAMLAGNFWENCGHFWLNKSTLLSTIDAFLFEKIWYCQTPV